MQVVRTTEYTQEMYDITGYMDTLMVWLFTIFFLTSVCIGCSYSKGELEIFTLFMGLVVFIFGGITLLIWGVLIMCKR